MAIKRRPEDFSVTEALDPAVLGAVTSRPGRHALYEVTKRGLTTHEAIDALCRRLHVRESDVAAAGLKDKQAVTTQHVTVRVNPDLRLPPERIKAGSFSARRLGYLEEAIDSKAIMGNRFCVVLRDLKSGAIEELHAAAARLATPPKDAPSRLRFTNYFGNQRFGSARAGKGFLAAHLIRGDFETALKLAIATPHRKDLLRVKKFKQAIAEHWQQRDWRELLKSLPRLPERAAIERLAARPDDFRGAFAALPYFFQQLAVEAYQSLLWNRIATTLLIDRLGDSGRLWVVDDQHCQLVFPESAIVPDDLAELDMPMLGRKTQLQAPWRAAAEAVLDEESLRGIDLKIPGLDRPWFAEVPRRLFTIADEFRIGKPERDDDQPHADALKVTLQFTLPRGGYATVLLRALGQ